MIVLWALPAISLAKDLGGGWNEKTNEEGKVVQELKIEAPSFTEEDQYGYNMPDMYRCDSCKAVMFHLNIQLQNVHPKSRRMKSWEYTDVFDDICKHATFEGYGVRLVDGENTLSGPGLKMPDTLAPGSGAIQMGGETWSKRLAEICRKTVYEKVGEDELYEAFYRKLRDVPDADGKTGGETGVSEALCLKHRECESIGFGPKKPKPAAVELPDATKPKKKDKAAQSKKDKAAQKKEKAAAAKAKSEKSSPASQKTSEKKPAAAADDVDMPAFLRSLAIKHGFTSDEYLAARTPREWEKLIVAMAGRIFNKLEDKDGSCQA